MGTILSALGLGKILAGLLGVLALVGGIFFAGKRSARKEREIADLKQQERDREKLDNIKPSDERGTIDRLRNNGF